MQKRVQGLLHVSSPQRVVRGETARENLPVSVLNRVRPDGPELLVEETISWELVVFVTRSPGVTMHEFALKKALLMMAQLPQWLTVTVNAE